MSRPFDEFFSADSRNFRASAIRAFAHLINDPRVISFAGGVPSPATFPAERIASLTAEILMGALREHFGGRAQWTEARGGLFTFLTVADGIDAAALVPRAIESGVAYVPGSAFFVDGSGANTMRLTFAKEPDDRMREGIARLARLIQ